MSQAKNGILYMEEGSTPQGYTQMVDSGDGQTFGIDGVDIFSGDPAPVCRPNGIVTGLNLGGVAVSGSNDVIDMSACTAYLAGVEKAIAADLDLAITRPATDVAKVVAVIINAAGAYAEVAGTDSADATFSAVLGAAGGPPFIPVDAIKVLELRLTSSVAAPITAGEIFQNGNYTERALSPSFDLDATGRGDYSDDAATSRANVKFSSALPLIHTGDVPKQIHLDYADPIMGQVSKSSDFTPAEESYSTSSSEHYGGVDAVETTSLGTAGFSAKMNDGVTDAVIAAKGKVKTFKFYPDLGKAPHLVTQGRVSTARSFAVGANKLAKVTLAPSKATVEYFS